MSGDIGEPLSAPWGPAGLPGGLHQYGLMMSMEERHSPPLAERAGVVPVSVLTF